MAGQNQEVTLRKQPRYHKGASQKSFTDVKQRCEKIIALLNFTYPGVRCELIYSNPLELLVATILSAQCTDKQVNLVTRTLFSKYKTAEDYASARDEDLLETIRSLGLFKTKAKNIKSACRKIVLEHGGAVPRIMEALISLDGVGRKTANVVLGNAFGIEAGVVVDTHVKRLAGRLRLSNERTPEKIERDLMKLVPIEQWTLFSHLLIWHGRRRCTARNPDCTGCEIQSLCPTQNLKDFH